MSPLLVRRLIVWGVSFALGFLVAYLLVVVGLPLININARGMTIDRYGIIYFLVTMVPLALVFVVWLDKFMGTKILPD
jgi:membrane-anchored protein YejM (alkaline phosphatase superfamily)